MVNKNAAIIMGRNIRRRRILMGLTVEKLAERIDVALGFLGLAERGQRGMKMANCIKISQVLKVTINDLIKDNEVMLREGAPYSKQINKK